MAAGPRAVEVRFAGGTGALLDGRLDLPTGEPRAWVVMAHCFTCHKHYLALSRIAHHWARAGLAVLRFDFTGLGESQGRFSETTFSTYLEDLEAAAEHLRRHYAPPTALFGHSLGGAAVVAAAPRIPEVGAVATLAAPSRPAQLMDHFRHVLPRIEAEGEARVEIGGRSWRLTRDFTEDLERHDLREALRRWGGALAVFHGPEDRVVPVAHAERLADWAPGPRCLALLEGADHLLTDRHDARLVAEMAAAWIGRYAPAR
jgi:putative redox protein